MQFLWYCDNYFKKRYLQLTIPGLAHGLGLHEVDVPKPELSQMNLVCVDNDSSRGCANTL